LQTTNHEIIYENPPTLQTDGQTLRQTTFSWQYDIRYDTIEEFNVDSKAEYTA